MNDGIHVPAGVVRVLAAVLGLALLALAVREAPELRRYLKIETM